MISQSILFVLYLSLLSGGLSKEEILLPANQPVLRDTEKSLDFLIPSTADGVFYILEFHTRSRSLEVVSSDGEAKSGKDASLVFLSGVNETRFATLKDIEANFEPVRVLLLLRSYPDGYPVPGSDLTFKYDYHSIYLHFRGAPLSVHSPPEAKYNIYSFYGDELDYDEKSYFTSFSEILFEEDARIKGTPLRDNNFIVRQGKDFKVAFASFPGTPRFFSVLLAIENKTVSYLPVGTYGCDVVKAKSTCSFVSSEKAVGLLIVGIFLGIILMCFGHLLYKTSQFIFGCLIFAFMGYVFLVRVIQMNPFGDPTYGWTTFFGILGGLFFLFAWICLKVPAVSSLLNSLVPGAIIACIILFIPSTNTTSLISNVYYWCTFAGIAGLCSIVMSFPSKQANIFSCALVGSFFIILGIDFYIGANLKFILVSVLRRATVPDFKYDVLLPPFQSTEVALVCAWIFACLLSLVFQNVREKNRSQLLLRNESWDSNENSPLLRPGNNYFESPEEHAAYLPVTRHESESLSRVNQYQTQRTSYGLFSSFFGRPNSSGVTSPPMNTPLGMRIQRDVFKPPSPPD